MGKKVIFKVFGHGELNGNYKIDIEKEMDAELAYKLRSKNSLIQFVKQECPGINIKVNTLDYKITPIKEEKSEAKKINTKKASIGKISTKGLSAKKIIGGAIAAAVIVPIIKEVAGDLIDEVKDAIKKAKKK